MTDSRILCRMAPEFAVSYGGYTRDRMELRAPL